MVTPPPPPPSFFNGLCGINDHICILIGSVLKFGSFKRSILMKPGWVLGRHLPAEARVLCHKQGRDIQVMQETVGRTQGELRWPHFFLNRQIVKKPKAVRFNLFKMAWNLMISKVRKCLKTDGFWTKIKFQVLFLLYIDDVLRFSSTLTVAVYIMTPNVLVVNILYCSEGMHVIVLLIVVVISNSNRIHGRFYVSPLQIEVQFLW